MYIPEPFKEDRIDVLHDAIRHAGLATLVSLTTDATVSAETMVALLRKIAALGLQGPITLVLDNARYQHCALVMDLAKSLNIHLEFLPSYSPNLNLIERLWKFIKKQVLYGRHYATFLEFRGS